MASGEVTNADNKKASSKASVKATNADKLNASDWLPE